MVFNLTCRLPTFRRVFMKNQYLYDLKNRLQSREFCSDLLSRYHEDKNDELKNRLRVLPCLNLMDQEERRIENDLCYEKDYRLEFALDWYSKVFNYNARHGKMVRATTLLKAFCTYGFNLDDSRWNEWESNGWRSAVTLAWCIELLQGFLIVTDDIIDQSIIRRGKPCWYKKPEVGLSAINDSLLLQSGIFKLLQKYFSTSKCYKNIFHEFLQGIHNVLYGQCMDILHARNRVPSFELYTIETFQTIAEYKADYTYRLPIHIAMHLVEGISMKEFDFTRKLCSKLGLYYQSLDDVLDYFGNPNQTGKYGSDIREGKCTWLAVKFLEEATDPIKKQFVEVYGIDDKSAIDVVVELYRRENLLEKFLEFDEQLCMEMKTLIDSMNNNNGAFFYGLISEAQNRKKHIIAS